MMTRRMKMVAVASLALGLAVGAARVVSAQFGGGPGGARPGSDEARLSTIGTNTLIAVETPEKDGLKLYRIEDGTWSIYRAPQGTRVRPLGGWSFIATIPEGPKITQLAAYSEQSRSWITQDLKEPVAGKMTGAVASATIVVYTTGRFIYAFSAPASKWGVLELPEAAEMPTVSSQVATLLHKDHLYIFNAKLGRWDNSGEAR